ncbi:hypothetical protein [Actinotalea sp. Marseille-Q4924]|uniref:hypothetical protein n=1 Tax=Actinotalea sp. Marseille-Q4924 TaxID=2866571 RepID=UPI001CE440AF|nr:hypothetical protein [Actinotalea sp. Marseille-Q4924]
MLQRALGALLCVLGLVVAGLAVASATVWRAPDTLTASATADGTLLMTDPGVLDLAADDVTVRAEADGATVAVALGRTVDVEGWVGEDPVTRVTGLADRTTLATDGGAGGAEQAAAPDPRGSDLWVEEVSGEGTAELVWEAQDGRWSVLVASVDPAVQPTLTLSWPQTVTTPWLVPGLVVGGLLLLAGLVLLLFALRSRRARPVASVGASDPALTSRPPGSGAQADGTAAAGDRPLTRREMRELQTRTTAGAAATSDDPSATTPMPVAPPTPADIRPARATGGPPADAAPGTTPVRPVRPTPARPSGAAPAPHDAAPAQPDDAAPASPPPAPSAPAPAPSSPAPAPSAPAPARAPSAWRQTWGLPGGGDAATGGSGGDTADAAAPKAPARPDADDTPDDRRTDDEGGAR